MSFDIKQFATAIKQIAEEKGILSENPTPAQCAGITYYQHVAANLSCLSDEELLKYQREAYSSFKPRLLVPAKKARERMVRD